MTTSNLPRHTTEAQLSNIYIVEITYRKNGNINLQVKETVEALCESQAICLAAKKWPPKEREIKVLAEVCHE